MQTKPVIRPCKVKNLASYKQREQWLQKAALCTANECVEWPWKRLISKPDPKILRYGTWDGVGLAHRLSLGLKLGRKLLPTEQAQHTCDNPPCCNGSHLKLGDHSSNMTDALSRGRAQCVVPPFGTAHHSAKMNPDSVRLMRRLRVKGYTLRALAELFGLAKFAVSNICARKTWRSVT